MTKSALAAAFCAAVLAVAALDALPARAQQPSKKSAPTKPAPAAKAAEPGGGYAQRFASLCAACHGPMGRSDMPGVPVLAGQPSFYVVTQLYLLREGRRNNEAMTAVAKTLTDADLSGYADYIGTLPPIMPPAPPQPLDAARMSRGEALAKQYRCVFCHGVDLAGGQQVPRLAGQHEDYVLMSLQGYKGGTRAGYTQAMNAVLSDVSNEDVATLAYYASHLPLLARPAGK